MDTSSLSNSQVVKAGFDRLCKEFGALILPFGFAKTRARDWSRVQGELIDVIHLHRSGASYGAPVNFSLSVRVHFATKAQGAKGPLILNGPSSDDFRGTNCNYHLRFNAHSWSTYDRCLDDLLRVTREQGLPWFAKQRL